MQNKGAEFLEKSLDEIGMELISTIPFDQEIMRADTLAIAPLDLSPNCPAIEAIKGLKKNLKKKYLKEQ